MTKPYLLFAYSVYYPSGGISDLRGAYATRDAAIEAAANLADIDIWEVLDAETLQTVAEGGRNGYSPKD